MSESRTSPRLARARLTLVVAAVLIVARPPARAGAQELAPPERDMAAWIRNHAEEAIAFLQRAVDINSGTMNHGGVRRVAALFREELDGLGFKTRWISMPDSVNRAGHLFAVRGGERGKRILLIGHLDTVFEETSSFQRFERHDSIASGPGVEDMKGGDVVMLYALKALDAAGVLDGTTITVALMGDEESAGLPISISRGDLIRAGRENDVALGFEGGVGGRNTATVARRGSSGWTLRVSGIRGHSSGIFGSSLGAGAVFETARILDAFYERVRGERYLTFNPGVILGGTEVTYDAGENRGEAFGKTNVIAQTVVVDGGLRFISEEQKEKARAGMREIVARNLPRTSARITFQDKYPAMSPTEGNYALLGILDSVSRDLGYGGVEPVDPGARGAADISFVAPDVDGLDGLGVVGSGGHTTEEVVDLRTLPVAAAKAAVLIYRLTRGDRMTSTNQEE
ncbi:MAG: M20/M25/M40 family metallo-hydrolase [Gemmatimonadota bacterium]